MPLSPTYFSPQYFAPSYWGTLTVSDVKTARAYGTVRISALSVRGLRNPVGSAVASIGVVGWASGAVQAQQYKTASAYTSIAVLAHTVNAVRCKASSAAGGVSLHAFIGAPSVAKSVYASGSASIVSPAQTAVKVRISGATAVIYILQLGHTVGVRFKSEKTPVSSLYIVGNMRVSVAKTSAAVAGMQVLGNVNTASIRSRSAFGTLAIEAYARTVFASVEVIIARISISAYASAQVPIKLYKPVKLVSIASANPSTSIKISKYSITVTSDDTEPVKQSASSLDTVIKESNVYSEGASVAHRPRIEAVESDEITGEYAGTVLTASD